MTINGPVWWGIEPLEGEHGEDDLYDNLNEGFSMEWLPGRQTPTCIRQTRRDNRQEGEDGGGRGLYVEPGHNDITQLSQTSQSHLYRSHGSAPEHTGAGHGIPDFSQRFTQEI